MSDFETIIRIAAKGDGVTSSGRHVSGTAPGDRIDATGRIEPGPHRASPPCPHFGTCGGCQLQHLDEEALCQFVTDRVVHSAEGQGLAIGDLLPTHLSPPRSRRRATLHAMRVQGGAVIGFRAAGSHRIVDLRSCDVLDPRLFALIDPLRRFVADHGDKGALDIELSLCDQGVDCSLKNFPLQGLAATEAALELAQTARLARLTLDQGYGAETLWEPEPASVSLSGVQVPFPSGSFLQATGDAERRICADALDWLSGARTVADLFAGLGTFAFAIAGEAKVLAVEAARDAHLACKSGAAKAAAPVHAMHRDLFRNPLLPEELGRFDAVVLDPPRAGAREQVGRLASSPVERVVYISCNPSSWARDARQLSEAGFKLQKLRPVGQFRWSTHVELASYFSR